MKNGAPVLNSRQATFLHDALLAVAFTVTLAGFGLIFVSPEARKGFEFFFGGLTFIALGSALLVVWERLVWGPADDRRGGGGNLSFSASGSPSPRAD